MRDHIQNLEISLQKDTNTNVCRHIFNTLLLSRRLYIVTNKLQGKIFWMYNGEARLITTYKA